MGRPGVEAGSVGTGCGWIISLRRWLGESIRLAVGHNDGWVDTYAGKGGAWPGGKELEQEHGAVYAHADPAQGHRVLEGRWKGVLPNLEGPPRGVQ